MCSTQFYLVTRNSTKTATPNGEETKHEHAKVAQWYKILFIGSLIETASLKLYVAAKGRHQVTIHAQ